MGMDIKKQIDTFYHLGIPQQLSTEQIALWLSMNTNLIKNSDDKLTAPVSSISLPHLGRLAGQSIHDVQINAITLLEQGLLVFMTIDNLPFDDPTISYQVRQLY